MVDGGTPTLEISPLGPQWQDRTVVFANERVADCTEKEFTENTFQHDLTVSYTADDWSVRGGVLNVFDDIDSVDDDLALANVAIQSGSDIFGRRFFVGVSKSF